MATTIFDNCSYSITSIKHLYIAARQTNGDPIEFPIDYVVKTGSSQSIIVVSDWQRYDKTVVIGGQTLNWEEVPNLGDNIDFNEEYVEGKQGKTYVKTLEFDLPNVNFTTNAVLKSFLFSSEGDFAISNALAFIIDDNNQQWLVGYDRPLILQDGMELSVSEENYYRMSFRSTSYSRTRNYWIST